jgi:hypothetical protein
VGAKRNAIESVKRRYVMAFAKHGSRRKARLESGAAETTSRRWHGQPWFEPLLAQCEATIAKEGEAQAVHEEMDRLKIQGIALSPSEIEESLARDVRITMDDFVDVQEEVYEEQDAVTGEPRSVRRSYPVFNWTKARERGAIPVIKKLKITSGFAATGLPWVKTELELYDHHSARDQFYKTRGLYKEPTLPDSAADKIWDALLQKLPGWVLRKIEQARISGDVQYIEALRFVGSDGSAELKVVPQLPPGNGDGNGDGSSPE